MAAEAEAAREARAKVIAAEGEHKVRPFKTFQNACCNIFYFKASRALKHAADIITDSPGALQLRYLQVIADAISTPEKKLLIFNQTLSHIADESNSTIIFPVPVDVISHFLAPPASQ